VSTTNVTDPTPQRFTSELRDHAHSERIVQAGTYIEQQQRLVAAPVFPQFVGVPDRNPRFVGRHDDLAVLERPGGSNDATVITQATVGMGGVGKTTLAAEFCHRHRGDFEVVRWLTAENRQTLETQYQQIASAVGLEVLGLALADVLARVRGWFETTDKSWLVVFDNAESPAVLAGLIPTSGRGRVMITSRHRQWAGAAQVQRLEVLDHASAVQLLCDLSGRAESVSANRLVEWLGRLALAVEQAGAYIAQTSISVDGYEQHLQDRAAELLAKPIPGVDANVTVMTVWDTSLQRAARDAPLSGNVLGVVAYTAADDLPRSLLNAPNGDGEPLLGNADDLAISEAVAALAAYSLIDITRNNSGDITSLSTHRLVQEVTRIRHATPTDNDAGDDSSETQQWCGLAVRLILEAFPGDTADPDAWPAAQRLASHVLVVTDHALRHETELWAVSLLLHRYGNCLRNSGDPIAAPPVFERALAIDERLHGPEHPDTLRARGNLAGSYRDAGRTRDAIALQEAVLADTERILGADHPDTLRARGNLAGSYSDAGRTRDAIALQEAVLADTERILGPDHPDTLRARGNLAFSYWSAGRTSDAIPIEEAVVADSERILGPDHPDTIAAHQVLDDWSGGAD